MHYKSKFSVKANNLSITDPPMSQHKEKLFFTGFLPLNYQLALPCIYRVLPCQLCSTTLSSTEEVYTISLLAGQHPEWHYSSWLCLTVSCQGNFRLSKILWRCLCKYNHNWDLGGPQLGKGQTTLHELSQTVVLDVPSGKVRGDSFLEMSKHVWNCTWMSELLDHYYTYYFCINYLKMKKHLSRNSLIAMLRNEENQSPT